MRILAFDASTDWLCVALDDRGAWHEHREQAGQSHSERILPVVDALLAAAGVALPSLDGIAFGAGPGSFTGLRIACGVAQGLALGAGLPLVAVSTLDALAERAFRVHAASRVLACVDARMHEVYVAACVREGDRWTSADGPLVVRPGSVTVPAGEWLGAGNGFALHPELATRPGIVACDPLLHATARDVATLARSVLASGGGVAPDAALPLYVRHRVALTTAERLSGQAL